VKEALNWYSVNRLALNISKTFFVMFGRQRALIDGLQVGGELVRRSNQAVYLGLRLDDRLTWSSHICYVMSRIRHVRLILSRFGYMFDRTLRVYLCKTLIFPVVNLYDIIYGAANSKYLSQLNVAYNDLMRTVLGLRRREHVKISDMHKLTGFEPLAIRRNSSLLKFMNDVKCDSLFSKIRSSLRKVCHAYGTRSGNSYIIPTSRTSLGKLRIAVRGLTLLNSVM
jgi:hypothetical protein